MLEPCLRLPPIRHRLVRIFVGKLREVEGDARQQACRLRDRVGAADEQARHFAGRLDVPLGVGGEPPARLMDGDSFADASDDVLERSFIGVGVQGVRGRQQRHAHGVREPAQPCKFAFVAPGARHGHAEPDATGRRTDHPGERRFQRGIGARRRQQRIAAGHGRTRAARRHDDQQQVVQVTDQVAEPEDAATLLGAQVAGGQQTREPPPAATRRGVGDDVGRAVGKDQPRADHQPERRRRHERAALPRTHLGELVMRAHDPRHGIAVGDADPLEAQRRGGRDHVERLAGPVEERIVGRRDEFGEAHANSPCRYQFGASVSEYRPWRKIQNRRPRRSSIRK